MMHSLILTLCTCHVSANLAPPTAATAIGKKRVLLVRTDFPDSKSSDTAWLPDDVALMWVGGKDDPTTQLAAYLDKSSFGRLQFSSVTCVPDLVRYPEERKAYSDIHDLYRALNEKMSADPTYSDFVPNNFDLVFIFWQFPNADWSWSGEAFPPMEGMPMVFGINGGQDMCNCGEFVYYTQGSFGLLTHEVCHALGQRYHAGAWVGPPMTPAGLSDVEARPCSDSDPSDASCTEKQGDPFDGLAWPSISHGAQYQASIKWTLGFIQPEEVHWAADGNGFDSPVRLNAHDVGRAAQTRDGAKLALAAVSQSDPSVWLWVEYKADYPNTWEEDGWTDAEEVALRTRAAIVHLASGPRNNWEDGPARPLLIDTTPPFGHGQRADSPLQVGRSLVLEDHNIVLTVLAADCTASPPWIEVMVGRHFEENTPPVINGIKTPEKVCVGQIVDVECDVSDMHTKTDYLSYEWDMGDGLAPFNSDSVRVRQWVFASAGSHTVQCTVSDGNGGSATESRVIEVRGSKVHENVVPATDSANQCASNLCAFITDGKYDYPIIYVNGKMSNEGWFSSMQWFTGYEAAAIAFDGVHIPKGTAVEAAYLLLSPSDHASNVGTVNIKVELSAAANGLTEGLDRPWSCAGCLTDRRTWTEAVSWAVPDATYGVTVQSPNFHKGLQALVQRDDWIGVGRIVVSLTPLNGDGVLSIDKSTKLVVKWQDLTDDCPRVDLTTMTAAPTAPNQPQPCYNGGGSVSRPQGKSAVHPDIVSLSGSSQAWLISGALTIFVALSVNVVKRRSAVLVSESMADSERHEEELLLATESPVL